jgi:hypothetical protein
MQIIEVSQQGFAVGQDPWDLTWETCRCPCRRGRASEPLLISPQNYSDIEDDLRRLAERAGIPQKREAALAVVATAVPKAADAAAEAAVGAAR